MLVAGFCGLYWNELIALVIVGRSEDIASIQPETGLETLGSAIAVRPCEVFVQCTRRSGQGDTDWCWSSHLERTLTNSILYIASR
jgi:hypothetical protein